MINKNLTKILSLGLVYTMAFTCTACSNIITTPAIDNNTTEIEENLLNTESLLQKESTSDKVETVYVMTDANGYAKNVVVSEWLKNDGTLTEINDLTNLKNITNVKGDETYTVNNDGTITWNTNGEDIYYQGTTDKEIPVSVKVTYYLNGNEIKPSELAGKSGKIKIRFDYENTDKQIVDVDGKDITVYTPFTMITGVMLDGNKFENIDVSNGKVISDGGKYIVVGMGMPGLKESFEIDKDKLKDLDTTTIDNKLSNYFEITADTTDFKLDMTVTMASSNILSDLNIADFTNTEKINNVKDDMNKLNNGANQLFDGSKELKNGIDSLYKGTTDLCEGSERLKNGGNELKEGTNKLYNGTESLYNGIVKYTDGAKQIDEGVNKLASGSDELKKGSTQLNNGIGSAKIGADKLSVGSEQVEGGVNTLVSSLQKTTNDSTKKINDSEQCLNATIAYMKGETDYNQLVGTGLSMIKLSKEDADKVITDNTNAYTTLQMLSQTLNNKYTEASTANTQLKQSIEAVKNASSGNVNLNIYNAESNDEIIAGELDNSEDVDVNNDENNNESISTNDEYVNSNIAEQSTEISTPENTQNEQINNLNAMLNAEQVSNEQLTNQNSAQQNIINSQQNIIDNQQVLIDSMINYLATNNMSAQINEATTAIATYQSYLHSAESAITTLEFVKEMLPTVDEETMVKLNQLLNGTQALSNGISDLDKGLADIYNGSNTLNEGVKNLDDGTKKLKDGSNELVKNNNDLVNGALQLEQGAKTLDKGAEGLNNGLSALYDGTQKLNNGANDLDIGMQKLLDGMEKFDEEGIRKLYEVFDGDITEFVNKLNAIEIAGKNYTTFGGSNSDNCNVKFIIKTGAIK